MDRFIDEQDSSRDRSSSPNFYSLMFGNAEGRKGLSLYPGAKSQLNLGENNGNAASDLSNRESSPASAPNPTSTVAVTSEMTTSSAQTTLNSGSNGSSSENPSQPSLPTNPKSPQQWFFISVFLCNNICLTPWHTTTRIFIEIMKYINKKYIVVHSLSHADQCPK